MQKFPRPARAITIFTCGIAFPESLVGKCNVTAYKSSAATFSQLITITVVAVGEKRSLMKIQMWVVATECRRLK